MVDSVVTNTRLQETEPSAGGPGTRESPEPRSKPSSRSVSAPVSGPATATSAPVAAGDDLRLFWGKLGRGGNPAELVPHPLICHAIDTAFMAELLFPQLVGPECRAELERAFQPLGGTAALWVAFLAGLHDLGKLSPAFQAKRGDVAVRHVPEPVAAETRRLHTVRKGTSGTDTFHGVLTAYHFARLLDGWGASRETCAVIAQALGGHHGRFWSWQTIDTAARAPGDRGGAFWQDRVDRMVDSFAGLLGLPVPAGLRWAEVRLDTGAAVALAGLTTISDWVASHSVDRRSHAGVGVDLEDYLALSRERARRTVLEELAWRSWRPPAVTAYADLFEERPRPVQELVEELVTGRTAPGLLVIEAPAGEGKTKAALQAATTVARNLGLTGLYQAMPTRATSNQAYEQITALLGTTGSDVGVALLHGAAKDYLADRIARLRPCEVGIDEPGGAQDAAVRAWFTRNRELLAMVGVGTIDRLLRAGIRGKWAPVPLTALSSRVVIIDEVHGYDSHMSTLLDRVLWWCGRLGVTVILLSATLPSGRRQDLIRHWCAGARRCRPAEIDAGPARQGYPQVQWVDRECGVTAARTAGVSPLNASRRLSLCRLTDDELVPWAVQRAASGAGVAIVHNLLRRIVATRARLTAALANLPEARRPTIIEITGRLDLKRRLSAEAELRKLFGPDGTRAPANGVIVLGTQVLEQSLDLDFDELATDPAPIDSLLQRAGRLRRFRLVDSDRPVSLHIVGVVDNARGPRWPSYTTNVYQQAVLLRTWALLGNMTELNLPADGPPMVDAVYGPRDAITCPPGWQTRWCQAADRLARSRALDEHRARNLYLPPPTAEDALLKLTQHPRHQGMARKPDGR